MFVCNKTLYIIYKRSHSTEHCGSLYINIHVRKTDLNT